MLKIVGVALLILWLVALTGWEYRTWHMQLPAPSGLNLHRLELCRDALARRRQLEDNYFAMGGRDSLPVLSLLRASSYSEDILQIQIRAENDIRRYCEEP